MYERLLGSADRLVVVDVETTGFYKTDRIVEVAAVTVDRCGEVIDEWDTLVNPERDVGPVHVHGISATMVSVAPHFDEIAEALARRLDGAVLAAHNLAFDLRMLGRELERASARFSPGKGVCTLRLTSAKLRDAKQPGGRR